MLFNYIVVGCLIAANLGLMWLLANSNSKVRSANQTNLNLQNKLTKVSIELELARKELQKTPPPLPATSSPVDLVTRLFLGDRLKEQPPVERDTTRRVRGRATPDSSSRSSIQSGRSSSSNSYHTQPSSYHHSYDSGSSSSCSSSSSSSSDSGSSSCDSGSSSSSGCD